MLNNRLYTFEDWLNEERYTYLAHDEFGGHEYGITGNYPNELLNSGKITKHEFLKIETAQKEAFNIVLDDFKQQIREQVKRLIINQDTFEEYKLSRVNTINSDIHSLRLGKAFKGKLLRRDWDNTRIDTQTYKKIINRRDNQLGQEHLSGLPLNEYYQRGNNYGEPGDYQVEKDAYFQALLLSIEKDYLLNLNLKGKKEISALDRDGQRNAIYELFTSTFNEKKQLNRGFTQKEAFLLLKEKLEYELFFSSAELKQIGVNISSFDSFIRTYRNRKSPYNNR